MLFILFILLFSMSICLCLFIYFFFCLFPSFRFVSVSMGTHRLNLISCHSDYKQFAMSCQISLPRFNCLRLTLFFFSSLLFAFRYYCKCFISIFQSISYMQKKKKITNISCVLFPSLKRGKM